MNESAQANRINSGVAIMAVDTEKSIQNLSDFKVQINTNAIGKCIHFFLNPPSMGEIGG